MVVLLFSSYPRLFFPEILHQLRPCPIHSPSIFETEKTEKEEFKEPYLAIGEQRWLFQDLMNLCLSDLKYLQGSICRSSGRIFYLGVLIHKMRGW